MFNLWGGSKQAGLELSSSNVIGVDKKLLTSDDNMYATGDCANAYHLVTGQKCWISLALRANQAVTTLADNPVGQATVLDGVAGFSVFKVFSIAEARSGVNFTEAVDEEFDPEENCVKIKSRTHGQPGSTPIQINMVADKKTSRLLETQMVGKEGVAHRINAVAVAVHNIMTIEHFSNPDLAYAPPFGPILDPF